MIHRATPLGQYVCVYVCVIGVVSCRLVAVVLQCACNVHENCETNPKEVCKFSYIVTVILVRKATQHIFIHVILHCSFMQSRFLIFYD